MDMKDAIVLLSILFVAGCASTFPGPSKAEKLQKYREAYFEKWGKVVNPDVARCIWAGKVKLGMRTDEVIASWGYPEDIHRTVGSWGVHEQWVYGRTYLYFEDGLLTSWQD